MTPLRLSLTGFHGIKSGLGRETLELDLTGKNGLVAFVGPNGHGKTTVLDSLTPYRLMAYRASGYSERSFSYYDETYGDALKVLDWEHGGITYQSRIVIKGANKTKKTEASLLEREGAGWKPVTLPDGTVSDGKTDTYDRCVHAIVGTPEMFFTAAFSAQERRRLCDYTPGDMKLLLSDLLGLDELLALSESASLAAKAQAALGTGLVAQMQELETAEAQAAAIDVQHADANATLMASTSQRGAARTVVQQATIVLAEVQAGQANDDQLRRERDRLTGDRTRVVAEHGTLSRQLDTDIGRATTQGLAADLKQDVAKIQRRADLAATEADRLRRLINAAPEPLAAAAALAAAREADVDAGAAVDANRTALDVATDKAAELPTLQARLAGIDREGLALKAVADGHARRSALITSVPCAGMDISSTCPLLSDAHAAKAEHGKDSARLDAMRTDRAATARAIEALAGAVTEVQAAKAALLQAEQQKAKTAVAVTATSTIVARAEATANLRTSLATTEAQITAEQEALAEKTVQVAARAAESTQAVIDLEARKAEAAAALASRLAGLDAAIAELPAPTATGRLAEAQQAAAAAEAALTAAEGSVSTWQNRVATLQANRAALADKIAAVQAVAAQARVLAEDVAQWKLLAKALGRDGIVALAIDDAGPTLAGLTNDLLAACYGPRFSVRIDTQSTTKDGVLREGFDIRVFDSETGDDKSLTKMSGGEKLWLNEAITRAIGLYNALLTGKAYGCLFSDESDGALDPERKEQFVRMKRRVMELGGYHTEFFITHTPELWGMADSVIDFGALREAGR